jgi:uncharacterized protein (TIGR00725 family)
MPTSTQRVSHVVRRPIIGIMGSHAEPYADRAKQVGEWVARQGYHLLTGAGDGVMGAASEAYVGVADRIGRVIGVVPSSPDDPLRRPLEGYPNPWVEIPIYTHLDGGSPRGDEPTSRNHINILTSTVVIVLPGGEGTASEARLSVRYGKPVVAYLRSPEEVPSLPSSVPVESTFSRVTSFVECHVELFEAGGRG